ncbi:PIN domain-containing protein [Flavobacterium sp. W1B]|uniref:PIN domain-containing protein n=1 Tax=Flavobacterium sp. W1B TaxID=3394146 RepID=UPI0039BCB232
MKNVILDTNIFIKENFLHGKKINSLISLSRKKRIQLYVTEITYNELKSNFKKFLSISIINHNRFRKDAENWILQNDNILQPFFTKIESDKIITDFELKLDNLIKDSIIKILPYKSLDIKSIFDKYFESLPPFGKGEKKSEFPDAFTLELIKDFCATNSTTAIVFSTDKDLLSTKYPDFTVRNDYDTYLEEAYTEIEKVKKDITNKLFLANSPQLKQEFVNWYKDNLEDDYSLYYDAVNGKDVYNVEVEEINVSELSYKIIEIVDDIITIEVEAKTIVKVDVLTDDDNYMYYDSDDKSYHYYETDTLSLEQEFDSSLIAYIEILDEDDYSEDFEIESINDNNEISFDTDHDYR